MCNIYTMTRNQEAIRRLFKINIDNAGNIPSLPGIYPDSLAPVVRVTEDGKRELLMMRWGMPGPPQFGGHAITNVRNMQSPHWRRWLGPRFRCLVPMTSFCEYADTKPRKTPTWFALSEDRPLCCFAGIWTQWAGTRGTKKEPVEGTHLLYGFLTCEPNAVVAPIHPKAMPVILTTPAECDLWLSAPTEKVLTLQRPLPDDALKIVATGERTDGD